MNEWRSESGPIRFVIPRPSPAVRTAGTEVSLSHWLGDGKQTWQLTVTT